MFTISVAVNGDKQRYLYCEMYKLLVFFRAQISLALFKRMKAYPAFRIIPFFLQI